MCWIPVVVVDDQKANQLLNNIFYFPLDMDWGRLYESPQKHASYEGDISLKGERGGKC